MAQTMHWHTQTKKELWGKEMMDPRSLSDLASNLLKLLNGPFLFSLSLGNKINYLQK